jgi:hypothetical protein
MKICRNDRFDTVNAILVVEEWPTTLHHVLMDLAI